MLKLKPDYTKWNFSTLRFGSSSQSSKNRKKKMMCAMFIHACHKGPELLYSCKMMAFDVIGHRKPLCQNVQSNHGAIRGIGNVVFLF